MGIRARAMLGVLLFLVQLILDTADFVVHGLVAISPGPKAHAGRNAWHTRGVEGLVTLLHGSEDCVPVTLDVGSVRMKTRPESRCREDALTDCDFF